MGKEGKRNKAMGIRCKVWPGAHWLLSLRQIILVFGYNSLWPGDCYNFLTKETVISDLADMTCFVLEDIFIHVEHCHWTMEPFIALIIEQTTENKKLKCALFSKNSVQNKYNIVRLKLENPLDIHFLMNWTREFMAKPMYNMTIKREVRAITNKPPVHIWNCSDSWEKTTQPLLTFIVFKIWSHWLFWGFYS